MMGIHSTLTPTWQQTNILTIHVESESQGLYISTFILIGAYIQKGLIFNRGLYFSIPPTFVNVMIIIIEHHYSVLVCFLRRTLTMPRPTVTSIQAEALFKRGLWSRVYGTLSSLSLSLSLPPSFPLSLSHSLTHSLTHTHTHTHTHKIPTHTHSHTHIRTCTVYILYTYKQHSFARRWQSNGVSTSPTPDKGGIHTHQTQTAPVAQSHLMECAGHVERRAPLEAPS